MRAAVRKLPKGTWGASMMLDGYEAPIKLRAALTVSDAAHVGGVGETRRGLEASADERLRSLKHATRHSQPLGTGAAHEHVAVELLDMCGRIVHVRTSVRRSDVQARREE